MFFLVHFITKLIFSFSPTLKDSRKSEEQKRNEKNLLNELLLLVEQRNEIVVQLDEENRK